MPRISGLELSMLESLGTLVWLSLLESLQVRYISMHKKLSIPLKISLKNLIEFTEEILIEKLHLLCSICRRENFNFAT